MLYELLYTSSALKEMPEKELLSILEAARSKNKELNVTGMLVYSKRSFMQILEGEKDVVLDLFDKIVKDDRHTSVLTFWEGEIAERKFKSWTMAFKKLQSEDCKDNPSLSKFLELGFTNETLSGNPSVGQELLISLRKDLVPCNS